MSEADSSGLLPRRIEYGLEGPVKTIVRCTPDPNADGYLEYRTSDFSHHRHPYLEDVHRHIVKPQDVCIGYLERGWGRLAQQLRELPMIAIEKQAEAAGGGGASIPEPGEVYTVPDEMITPINLVLETVAIEASDPEFNVSFANECVDFTGLLETKSLQLSCGKVIEQVAFHMDGRRWLERNLVAVKLAEIIEKYTGSDDEEEIQILYSIGKALHRWTGARDGVPDLTEKGIQKAIVCLLSNITAKTILTDVEFLVVLEMTHALFVLAGNNPIPVLQSNIIGHLARFMEHVYADTCAGKVVPNKDFVLEGCLSILTQAGNTAEGRNILLANDAEGICARLVFESDASRVQDAATGACSVISLHKEGKARLESFLMNNNFDAFVRNLAVACTSQKLKFVQSLSAKPSFRVSFLREAIRADKLRLIIDVFGVAAIPTAFLVLDEMPGKVIVVLQELLAIPYDPSGGPDYISIGIRFGLPASTPSQISYENCVDIVPRLASYYKDFPLPVMNCFCILHRDDSRFKPVFETLCDDKSAPRELVEKVKGMLK